jgi:von Willebrand factor type A domain/Inner membrane component of T3SS, cytoplasmic domain
MSVKLLVGISLLLVSHLPLVWAESFRIGPVYTQKPGEVSVVVELPPGVYPTAAHFRLLIDDNPIVTAQALKAFRDSGQGMALAVCVDVSGTMSRGPLNEAKGALLTFLGSARPEDRIALITFANDEETLSSFDEKRERLAEAVRNLKTRGKETRLYQAIYNALDIFQGPTLPKRRRLIVISDGKDEGSKEGAASVITKARTWGIPIDSVGRGRIEEQYAEALRGLSSGTGGYFEHARPDILSLTDALARIYENLSRSLVVTFVYKPDDAGRTTQNARIELQQPGQPWRAEIPTAISQVQRTIKERTSWEQFLGALKDQLNYPRWLLWLALVGVLAVGVFVLIRHRRGNGQVVTQPVTEKPPVVPSPQSPPAVSPVTHLRGRRQTHVGSHYFPVPKLGHPTAMLIGVSGPVEGQQFSVAKDVFHIGASPENDLPIAGDEYVSGNHAYLRYENGRLFIFDKGSRNGTSVNQHEVTADGFELCLGDRILVGRSTLQVGITPN